LPNPGILARYEQYMTPLEDVVDLGQFAEFWQDLGTVNGTVYGVFAKADTKSIVWYSPPVFDAFGWETPETWDALQTLMDDMVEQGEVPPWSCGIESGEATGWVATDWIQDILLRTQGADFIEQWVRHEVAWTDPAIKDAWQTYYDVCASDTYAIGGAQGTLNTTFQNSIQLVFQEPPEGYMVRHGLFAAGIISNQFPELEQVDDYAFFAFPQFNDEIGAPMQGSGDVMAFFGEDNQAAVAFLNYLVGTPGQQMVAQTGWGLSPNSNITADDYTDPFQGRAAEILNEAPAFSFDADDRMPGGLNTVYWQATVDYLSGGDLDQILQDLEQEAVEAYEE
jgi:alpha-glucoside transport system substrate-binding protein